MAQTLEIPLETVRPAPVAEPEMVEISLPVYRAYQVLYWSVIAFPILVGLDKFLHLLTNWDAMVSTEFNGLIPFRTHTAVLIAGLFEIAAGVCVALKPRIGAWILTGWFALGTINLILLGGHNDLALCSVMLCAGAVALGFIAGEYN